MSAVRPSSTCEHAGATHERIQKNAVRGEHSPKSASETLQCTTAPSQHINSSPAYATQTDDVCDLLENESSLSSSDSDVDRGSASFMRVGNAGNVLAAAGQGASSIMRAIDALKDGSRQASAVQLHTRTPEAGNGLPFAGLIDAATGTFKFAPGTSSCHFVRHSLADPVNAQLPRLYPAHAPEMQIKRLWDQKKGCWCQRWVPAAAAHTETYRKKSAVSFTVDTNLSPGDADAFSGSGSKYRYLDSAASPAKVFPSPSMTPDQSHRACGHSDSADGLTSGISFLGHDAKSIAGSATAPHTWRAWGAAAVRVHARHAVSASCLYREIRAHAENLDEALQHLAGSCSVWRHGYSVVQSRCASMSQKLHSFRIVRVMLNVWKRAVNVRTCTLQAARRRALRLPKMKQLFHAWRLTCVSTRVRLAVASMFNVRCRLPIVIIFHFIDAIRAGSGSSRRASSGCCL